MLDLPDAPVSRIQDVTSAEFGVTDAHFLKTMGISLLRGRDFADSATATTQPVALVSQEFRRRYFPDRDPIGQKIHIGPPKFLKITAGATTADDIDVTIVGIFNDFRSHGLAESPEPQIIGLYSQQPIVNYGFKDIVVRTASEPQLLVLQIENQLHALDPGHAPGGGANI